jgi:hypothetical protein
MWESRRDFQRVWEGWEAGTMAFHAFHTLSFAWPAFSDGKLDKLICRYQSDVARTPPAARRDSLLIN